MIRQLPLIAPVFFLALPAAAEPWIDYDLLMQSRKDEVVSGVRSDGKGYRRLELEGGVTVTCEDGGGCSGVDRNGAVGCLFLMVAEIRATAAACDFQVSQDEQERLDQVFARVGAFVEKNAVPPMDPGSLDDYTGSLSSPDGKNFAEPYEGYCSEAETSFREIAGALTGEQMSSSLDSLLSTPRLPVINPCL